MSSPLQLSWKRFIRKPSGVAGGAIALVVLLLALLAPILATHDPVAGDLQYGKLPPSSEHYFGTDEMGRDIYSRILHGSRYTLSVGFIAVGIAMALGVPLALLTVAGKRWLDLTITGLIDIFLAFPSLVLALAIIAILGQNLMNAMIAIGIVYTPRFARIVRGAALTEVQRDYVAAARSLSCSMPRILFRHILPNCLPVLTVAATLHLASAILEAAALSFLGLGAQPPSPEWGAMLYEGRHYLMKIPSMTYFPGAAIFITVLAINLLGDALNDAFSGK
ncbi:MAG: ABC transporter permease [Anaerolineae bacterium]|nr:ABC transporter permease [Anaerolineae bacterium]